MVMIREILLNYPTFKILQIFFLIAQVNDEIQPTGAFKLDSS
jgi:hypothetical protein